MLLLFLAYKKSDVRNPFSLLAALVFQIANLNSDSKAKVFPCHS